MKITEEEIEKARTSKGGWTRDQLAAWGVSWPPQKGWKKRLLGNKKKKDKVKKIGRDKDFYNSREWAKLRYEALKLSNGKCELCSRTNKESILHVDHIKPRHKYPNLELDLGNLQVLCATCNYGKSGWDETDWRDDDTIQRYLNAMAKDD